MKRKKENKKTASAPEQPADPRAMNEQLLRNIQARLDKGQHISVAETKLIRDFLSTGTVESLAGPEWAGSYQQLADALGCHHKSFRNWRLAHSDCPTPRQDGKHNVNAWREWFKKHPEIRGVGDITAEMAMLELEELRQKVRKSQHLNDVREKLYVKVSDYCAQIGAVNGKAKAYLRQKLEFEAPSYLANQPAATVRVLLKRVVDEICVTLSELEKDLAI